MEPADTALVGMACEPCVGPTCQGDLLAHLFLLFLVNVKLLRVLTEPAVAFVEGEFAVVTAGETATDTFPVAEDHIVDFARLALLGFVFLDFDVVVGFGLLWHGCLFRKADLEEITIQLNNVLYSQAICRVNK